MSIAPDLIPVRALNQVSYYPRLYYLEYVEAVMPTNEFVEDDLPNASASRASWTSWRSVMV